MTEDTMRQLLMAQLAPAPGASPTEVHGAIDAILRTLRQARDGEGPVCRAPKGLQQAHQLKKDTRRVCEMRRA